MDGQFPGPGVDIVQQLNNLLFFFCPPQHPILEITCTLKPSLVLRELHFLQITESNMLVFVI